MKTLGLVSQVSANKESAGHFAYLNKILYYYFYFKGSSHL